MSLQIHVIGNILSPAADRESFSMTHAGLTVREIRNLCKRPNWADDEVQVIRMGRPVPEPRYAWLWKMDELDLTPGDGESLVLAPKIELETVLAVGLWILLNVGIPAAISVGTSWAIAQLMGKPKLPQIRGESLDSPVYGWEGMGTAYGIGSRIGYIYGRHRVPGQVVSSNLFEVGTDEDVLGLTIALGKGRVAKIAGIDLTSRTDWNNLGGLYPNGGTTSVVPSGIRLNGTLAQNSDMAVHIRAGTAGQTPLPGAARSYATFPVEKPMANTPTPGPIAGPLYTTTAPTSSVRARFRIDYSYSQQPTGPGPTTFTLRLVVRDPVTGAGMALVRQDITRQSTAPYYVSLVVPTPTDKVYNIEGRIQYVAADNVAATWTAAVEELHAGGEELAFPGIALIHLDLRATERLSGSTPTITVPVDGRMVAWKSAGVWQAATFETVGKVPGRNPAWILYDFLTAADACGRWIDPATIDEDSFEEWAEFCDELVDDGDGGTHPRHQCDLVIDRGESAWDVILRIARCGRAVPIPLGNGYRIHFEHPDSGSFPRPVRGLFTESNIEDLQIDYRDKLDRPTIMDAQILNEDLDYEQDLVSQEDPDAFGLNEPHRYKAEPFKRESVDLFGITRPAHARRELAWMLATNRKSKSQVRFSCSILALGAEIGDLIGIQHDVPDWHGSATGGFRTARAETAAATIQLDHDVTLAGGTTYQVAVIQSDNTIAERTITSVAGAYVAGSTLTLNAAITCRKAAVVAFGEADKVLRIYQITDFEHLEEWKFRVTASLYDETAFDLEENIELAPLGPDIPEGAEDAEDAVTPDTIESLQLHRSADGLRVTVSWLRPEGSKGPVRIYYRPKLSAAEEAAIAEDIVQGTTTSDARWDLVFEGEGSEARVDGLQAFAEYEFIGVMKNLDGVWASPATATPVTVFVEEFPLFPPPNVGSLRATHCGDGVMLRWGPVVWDGLEYYEIRRGSIWLGAEVVGRTTRPAYFDSALLVGEQTYQVAARHRSGLYSPTIATVTVTTDEPASFPSELDGFTDIDPSLGGTAVDVELAADGSLVLSAGKNIGTYETVALDSGSLGTRYLSLLASWWEEYQAEAPWDLELRSGEAHWWRMEGREATIAIPGVDFDLDTDDPDLFIEDDTMTFAGPIGGIGTHTRVKIEVAVDTGGGFGAWTDWHPGPVRADLAKFRFTLQRESEDWQVHVAAELVGKVLESAFGGGGGGTPSTPGQWKFNLAGQSSHILTAGL